MLVGRVERCEFVIFTEVWLRECLFDPIDDRQLRGLGLIELFYTSRYPGTAHLQHLD